MSREPHVLSSPRVAGGRRGGVMVMTLACMAVASVIGLAMLRSAMTAHRSLRTELHLRQVERLLVAAADVARSRHAAGSTVEGEMLLEPALLSGAGSARITFAVDPADPQQVRIAVDFPLEGPLTVRRSRTMPRASPSNPVSQESLP